VPLEFITDKNRVIVLGEDAYTLKKTGETFRSPYAMIVSYEDERIKGILIIQDLSGMAAAYR
jgi:ketosteroid isomerase-like protein